MHNIVIDQARARKRRPRELFAVHDRGDPRAGDPVTAAELLGVSPGTVKSTASRAVAQLRTQPGLIALFTSDTTR